MRRRRSRHRRRRRSTHVSESIAGYTRILNLADPGTTAGLTALHTVDVMDVMTPSEHTENRKILRVEGQAMFSAALAANQQLAAQFCLWAHPEHEDWPTVADYDPFTEGPGETAFEGMLAPRAFCRRTFVLATPASGGVTEVIQTQHMIRSRAQRLLRPGWKLTAGLYVSSPQSNVTATWHGLLRTVVAG